MLEMAQIIKAVYEQLDAFILDKISMNEFSFDYLVVEHFTTNTGTVIVSAKFMNALPEDDYGVYTFLVEELNRNIDYIKGYIEGL